MHGFRELVLTLREDRESAHTGRRNQIRTKQWRAKKSLKFKATVATRKVLKIRFFKTICNFNGNDFDFNNNDFT